MFSWVVRVVLYGDQENNINEMLLEFSEIRNVISISQDKLAGRLINSSLKINILKIGF